MEEISHIVDYAAKLAKEVEWLYSGDTGEETFMWRVQKIELERPWVGLTDAEYQAILKQHEGAGLLAFYNLVETQLKRKNV
jgi:hypothetical protein